MAAQSDHAPHGAAVECQRAPVTSVAKFNLTQIDVTKFQDFDEWLALLTACKVAGVSREDFVSCSVTDPDYADDAESVRDIWNRVKPNGAITEATLFRALRRNKGVPGDILAIPKGRRRMTSRDRARIDSIADVIAIAKDITDAEDKLYWAGCRYGECRMEIVIADDILEALLIAAGWRWGLRNKRRMRRQIRNGMRDGARDWHHMHHGGKEQNVSGLPFK